MQAIISTLIDRKTALIQALWQHLGISIISLLIAMAIAIPLAIWVEKHAKTAAVLLQIAGVLQTIPSLALLGLLIPFVGIGTVPAIIALVVYALLPIFQNTYIGIQEIDPSIEEAADAFGMSRMRKLVKVELPIAMPVIISGVRTALVMIIGTATLAALIGAGGLGTFILLGIDRNNTALVLIGAVASALLAIVLSYLIHVLQRVEFRYSIATLAVVLLGFVGYGTFKAVQQPTDQIVIAGKLGSEPDILINMYKELIEQEDPNMKVTLKSDFGKTSFLFSALRNNQIDIYPEFSGTVLESLVKTNSSETENLNSHQTYELAKKKLASQYQLDYLKPMKYNNTYALAVTKKFAKENHISKISDLTTMQNKIKAGMTLEFIDRSDGLKGLKKIYGLTFTAQSMEPDLRYQALAQGKVNLVDAYSTDSQLRQYNLVTLKDDRNFFPTYQGAPLMSEKLAKQHPEIVKTLNKLSNKISETDMQEMNYKVNVLKQSPKKVAQQYLKQHNLLK
ncbi:ABC transporter permease/substrate-binding protein [Paucilactobacillus wasatchensis]|uniref:L-proline glycine betaine binding ABC transporter protein ProX n=1 Tax=Paucilactobacillus wasatchensis TaxID=1335616 RepID=A0A0D0YUI1_9LACO|nr:ABC transporter permease/substrate-binding protein [Paucilactobacillus wasatchensis]KIS02924.1 L-proline glycine betaine binding ABC transporter protein ProX [Paucilactobacillus wasatchensis]